MKTPKTLRDVEGRLYKLVRPARDLSDGRQDIALYDSVPRSARFQYTPSLAFIQGIAKVPTMLSIQR